MRSLAQARIKRLHALELAADGCSYDEIARRAGYAHRGSAHRAVFKALDEREVEEVEELRAVEVARLDRLMFALWDRALDGEVAATNAVLRIIEARMRILGLQGSHTPRQVYQGPTSLVMKSVERNPGMATLEDLD